jgi:hypothetical protein
MEPFSFTETLGKNEFGTLPPGARQTGNSSPERFGNFAGLAAGLSMPSLRGFWALHIAAKDQLMPWPSSLAKTHAEVRVKPLRNQFDSTCDEIEKLYER